MSPVWSIPAYNTDEDAWRQRMEAKAAEQHRLWALAKAAREAPHKKTTTTTQPKAETPPEQRTCHCGTTFQPTRPSQQYCSEKCRRRARYHRDKGTTTPAKRAEREPRPDTLGPCKRCGRTLRALQVKAADHPGTVAVYASGLCKMCHRITNAPERPCAVCGGPIPPEARSNQVYCSRQCLERRPGRRVGTDRIYGPAPCPGCGRITRPKRTTLDDYPGTVQRHRGMCKACAAKNRERAA